VLVNYDFSGPFWLGRTGYYGITAMPAVVGDGVSLADAWTGLEADYQSRSTVESPLGISLTENGEGDFTARIKSDEDIVDARLFMVAVMDDHVPGATSTVSHLAYHAMDFMTTIDGEAFSVAAGESTEIRRSFSVDPEWEYGDMGVACWVQRAGGVNGGPSPDIPIANEVLQSAFAATGQTGVPAGRALVSMRPPRPNPTAGESRLSFTLERPGRVSVHICDVAGRRVRVLDKGELGPGPHEVLWDGRNEGGDRCATGVYLASLVLEGRVAAGQKLVVIR
jgi:hypothetical protein